MICTKRDTEMLQTLGRYGVLSTDQLAKKFFVNVAMTTVRRRLRAIEKAELIYRVHGLDNGGVAWALTKNAAQKLGCAYPARHFSRNSITHDVALSEVRNVFEGVGLCQSWVPEHVLKTQAYANQHRSNDEMPFVPDAIVSVRQKTESRVIALELELTGKNQKRYENILDRYRRKKTLWAVWYLVPNENFGKMLEKVWRKVNDGRRSDLLIWSLLPSLLHDPLNTHVRSEHFSYSLKSLFLTTVQSKVTALPGALSESTNTNKSSEKTSESVF